MDNRVRPKISVSASLLIALAASLFLIPVRWVFAWYVAVTIHELGHFVTIKLSGGQVVAFSVGGKGCRMETVPMSDIRSIVCLLAGPAAGILPLLFARFIPRIAICGLLHSVFNLLPIYPLDGGKILRILINCRKQKRPCKDLP